MTDAKRRPYRGRAIFSISAPLFWAAATGLTYLAVTSMANMAFGVFLLLFMIWVVPAMIWLGGMLTLAAFLMAVQLAREGGNGKKWGLVGMVINGTILVLLGACYVYLRIQEHH